MQLQLHHHLPLSAAAAALVLLGPPLAAAAPPPLELTLGKAVELAVARNRAILAAEAASRGESLSVATAESAFDLKLVPSTTIGRIGTSALTTTTGYNSTVGLQVSRRFETGTVLTMGPSYNRAGDERNTTLNVSLEQPLVRGWRPEVTLDPVRRAQFSLASAGRASEQARVNVALEAIGAYYGLLRERRLLAFAAAQRDRIDRHASIAQSKERNGIIGPMDFYRATIRLKDAQDALNQERVAVQAAENRLRRALDLPLDTPLAVEPPAPARLDDGRIEDEAVERRIEIVQLRAELAEAERQAEVARLQVAPEVTLRVSAGQATELDPFLAQYLPSTQRQWSVYLQSSTDFARVAEKNAYRQALLRVDAARLALETRIEEVRRQVREQRLQLEDAGDRIALREAQIREAEARLALAQVKFQHDMASNLDVIDAEGELQRAETSLAAARADYAVGIYQLRALAGHLLDAFAPQRTAEAR
jgi:outer membrane protein TolC